MYFTRFAPHSRSMRGFRPRARTNHASQAQAGFRRTSLLLTVDYDAAPCFGMIEMPPLRSSTAYLI